MRSIRWQIDTIVDLIFVIFFLPYNLSKSSIIGYAAQKQSEYPSVMPFHIVAMATGDFNFLRKPYK